MSSGSRLNLQFPQPPDSRLATQSSCNRSARRHNRLFGHDSTNSSPPDGPAATHAGRGRPTAHAPRCNTACHHSGTRRARERTAERGPARRLSRGQDSHGGGQDLRDRGRWSFRTARSSTSGRRTRSPIPEGADDRRRRRQGDHSRAGRHAFASGRLFAARACRPIATATK